MPRLALPQHELPGAARRAVLRVCRGALPGRVCEDSALLLTSEVVTNALVHGRGDVLVSVDRDRDVLRVEVSDDDPRHPRVPDGADELDPAAEGGRGMRIVDLLASAWGVRDRSGGGKHVWFELPVRP